MSAVRAEELPQHLSALRQANRVRLARAELKRTVAEGESSVAEVLATVPWEAESMTISDLLMAQHRWGRSRTRRFLLSVPMTETKTLGSMTTRQRRELVKRLSGPFEGPPVVSRSLPQPPPLDYLQTPL